MIIILNEKLVSENSEKNFFVDLKHKTLMFLHSHIGNDNKNIYMFIKNNILKKFYTFLIKNYLTPPFYTGLFFQKELCLLFEKSNNFFHSVRNLPKRTLFAV